MKNSAEPKLPMDSVERVLMVAPEFLPSLGGMQIHSWKTAEILAGKGVMVEVLTLASAEPLEGSPPFGLHRVLTRDFSRSLGLIIEAANRFGSQVILLMNAGYSPLAALEVPGLPPIVVRTAGNDAYAPWDGPRLPFRFLFWHLPHSRPGSLGARLRRLDQIRRSASVLAALPRCARILCNSSYTAGRLRDLGIPAARLHTVVGGVDTGHFSPRPPQSRSAVERKTPMVLGVAGHLLPVKGIDVALRALSMVAGPSTGSILRIAGTGPEEGRLRGLCMELGLQTRTEFIGEVTYDAMPAFYHSLDLYLQPSVEIRHPASGVLQAESMGRAVAEAMSCRLPVIASRSGGIPDVVQDCVDGYLVPPGDSNSLARSISNLLSNPEQMNVMGESGRGHAVDHLSWEAVVDGTFDHLRLARQEQLARGASRGGQPPAGAIGNNK